MEKRSFEDVEQDILAQLTAANLSKDHLAGISRSIADSYGSGLQIVDWWIDGIPSFEKLIIQAQLPIAEIKALKGLVQNECFKAIEIHKKGFPNPDFFQLQLTVERNPYPLKPCTHSSEIQTHSAGPARPPRTHIRAKAGSF
ncbi:hypothetical protein [Puia sp.]|uniref:hypothetical protein n=1 Tax=Puia sp. TaxID=2045100 RepID=UPI002F4170F1